MPDPLDYAEKSCLIADAAFELHEVALADRPDPVWIKCYRSGSADERLARGARELEMLQSAEGPGVPRVIEVHERDGDPVLVLEPAPGECLLARIARAPLTPVELVRLGAELAKTLARLHAARLVHLALSADAIWIDEGGSFAQIVDFGSARPIGERERRTSTERLRGAALLYLSPEGTHRMGIGTDARSDLYALGACLYHAATGEPPFAQGDPLALIHAHIARMPRHAVELRPDLPATLSRIISKLLQKSPEARYQTAAALERDLVECAGQLEEHGAIDDDLILATADAPYRPLFSKKLYGRDQEVDALEQACARACGGEGSAVFLAGSPGIGKSALVSVLRKSLADAGGYLAQGKFDLYRRDVPYEGIADALNGALHQVLTEDDERLRGWRAAFEASLGPAAGALVELVPDLGLVMGEVPPVERLPAKQTLARLALAIERLLQALGTRDHPLVLFLDDLQWADGGSRELLLDLFARPRLPYVLFVGAYRDNAVDRDHPFHKLEQAIEAGATPSSTIHLAPLDDAACAEMLADALGRATRDVRGLAVIIAQKTARNPLLIQQYVAHLYDLGLIRFEVGTGWIFDEDEISGTAMAEGAEELLAARIEPLASSVQRTLELAACVGDEFDVETLCALTDQPKPEIEASLFTLCDEGLVAPSHKGFRFAHDRIREAAQARIPSERRAALHYHAARLLLSRTPPDRLGARAFEIADHLNLGATCAPRDERPEIVEMNRRAGDQALRAGASRVAQHYFATALDHLEHLAGDDAGPPSPVTHAHLYLQAAEAAIQVPDLASAAGWLDALAGASLPRLLDARIESARMQLHIMGWPVESGDAADAAVAAVRRFGVRWPKVPSRLRTRLVIWYTDWVLRGPLDELRFRPTSGDPSEWLAPILVLGAAAPILQARTGRAVCELSGLALRYFLRRGYVRSPAHALASYAAFRRVALGHTRGMERLADAAMYWADRVRDPVWSARTGYVVYAYVHPWTRSRREAVAGLERVMAQMIELGDRQYQWFAATVRACYLAVSGEPLADVEASLRSLFALTARPAFATYADLCRALTEEIPGREHLEEATDRFVAEFDDVPASRMGLWPFWLSALCILGRYDLARRLIDGAAPWAFEVGAASAQLADYVLFRGVTASVMATDRRLASRNEPRGERRMLRRSLRQLRSFAKHGRDFSHMVRLLEAESARVAGELATALDRYRSAADQAAQVAHVHHVAFACERAAQLLVAMHCHDEARAMQDRAASAYDAWGAHAKARLLRGGPSSP